MSAEVMKFPVQINDDDLTPAPSASSRDTSLQCIKQADSSLINVDSEVAGSLETSFAFIDSETEAEWLPFSEARCYSFVKSPGFKIVLESHGDGWQATVHDDRFPGLSCSYAASVRFGKGYRLEDLRTRSPTYQSRHIHILSRFNDDPVVFVGSLGLKGGGGNQSVWKCAGCGFQCPNNRDESRCTHIESNNRCKTCITAWRIDQELKRREELEKEQIERITKRREQIEIKIKTVEENLIREDLLMESFLQKEREKRATHCLAAEEELTAKKQEIQHQSFCEETKDLYEEFISNLEMEINLREGVETAVSNTDFCEENLQTERNSEYHLEIPSGEHVEEDCPFSDECPAPSIQPALPPRVRCPVVSPARRSNDLPLFSPQSDSGDDFNFSDHLSEYLNGASPMSSSRSLEELSRTNPTSHTLRKSATVDNLFTSTCMSNRDFQDFVITSPLHGEGSPLSAEISESQQWVISFLYQLSLGHLSQLNANASDVIAPILYDRFIQSPEIAPSVEDFIYNHRYSIAESPFTFIELLELIRNYQIKKEITSSVLRQLVDEQPSGWMAEADRLIVAELFQPGHTYSVEELIELIVEPGSANPNISFSRDPTASSFDHRKRSTMEKVLTKQVVENLKPAIRAQLKSVISAYEEKLAVLEDRVKALENNMKREEAERANLTECFNKAKEFYESKNEYLEREEKRLRIEIIKLGKEIEKNQEELKFEESGETLLKLEKHSENLKALLNERSNSKISHGKRKEDFEYSVLTLTNKIKFLEVDKQKLESDKKRIKSKIERLSKESATNFSDFSLYKEVLDSLCKSTITFENKPFDTCSESALTTWSKQLKTKGSNLFHSHTISEIISAINQAASLSKNTTLTQRQHLDLLTSLFPFCKRSQSKNARDPLVVIFLTVICAFQNGKVSLVTDSKEWSISESYVSSYLPLFNILDLTVTKKDVSDPSSSYKSDIVYGQSRDFSAFSNMITNEVLHKKQPSISSDNKISLGERSTDPSLEAAPVDSLATDLPQTAPIRLLPNPTNSAVSSVSDTGSLPSVDELVTQGVSPSSNADSLGTEVETSIFADGELKKHYDSINRQYQSPSRILSCSSSSFKDKPISEWNSEELNPWATYVQSNFQPGSEIELIAGVQHAVRLIHEFLPKPAQLLALLILLNPRKGKGRLVEIKTGEGKSLIVAMLAAIYGLQGRLVDVITTSTELSILEAKKQDPFFQLLHLSVGENSKSNKKSEVYKKQIVYGIACDFQADILLQEFLGENTRGDRDYDIVIVDEVDSLLFDNRSHSVRLSSQNPGMDHLKLPLGAIWNHIQWLTNHMFKHKDKIYFTAADSIDESAEVVEVIDEKAFIVEMTSKHMSRLLRTLDSAEAEEYRAYFEKKCKISELEKKIKSIKDKGGDAEKKIKFRDTMQANLDRFPWSKRDPILDIPNHLRQFSRIQLPRWINNCLHALYAYEKNAHYTVSEEGRIVPVQHNETGELQHNLVWSDGLCQFLQFKEGLLVEPESVSTNSLSNVSYFQRYGDSIYGLTGTLGDQATRSFLEELYNVDFWVIPPHVRVSIRDNSQSLFRCKELSPVLVEEKDWFPAILYHLLHHAKRGRAVLAICKYIWHAEYLVTQLKALYRRPRRVFSYTGVVPFEKRKIYPGEIVIATNIAGRGTDFETSPEVEEVGGMYVAVTFFPESESVLMQAFGRTARGGKKGMAQLILSIPDGRSIDDLIAERRSKETQSTLRALQDARRVWTQDALFQHFCIVENEYLPRFSDCGDIDLAETVLPKWNQFLDTEFTDSIMDQRFQEMVTKHKRDWSNLFPSGGPVPCSDQLENDLLSRKDSFKSAYRDELLVRFLMSHPILSPSLLSCLKTGKSFVSNRSALAEKYDWGVYERRAVEERWGIWLKQQQDENSQGDLLRMLGEFEQFARELSKDAEADQLIKNPHFFTLKGNKLLSKGRRRDAIKCYDRAIELDPLFSLHSHYNKARALLTCKANKGKVQEDAYKELKIAETLIHTIYRPNLTGFHGLLELGCVKSQTVTAIQRELHLVSQHEMYIEEALRVLYDSGATGAKKKPTNVKLTTESLSSTIKDPEVAVAFEKSIEEMVLKGLPDLFTLENVPPFPTASIVSLALVSITQIAVGCVMTAYGGVQCGLILIRSGISDMITTIRAAFKGKLDWGAWAIQKGIEIAVSVAGFLVKVVKDSVMGVKTTAECLNRGVQSGVQSLKDIVGFKGLPGTIKTATGEVMKEAPGQVAKNLLKTELTQGGVTEVVHKTCEYLHDELLVKTQSESIKIVIRRKLLEAFRNNELITEALKQDRDKGDVYWQQSFLLDAYDILNDMLNPHRPKEILKQVAEKTACNTIPLFQPAKNFFYGIFKRDEVAPLAKEFIEIFDKRISSKKDDIIKKTKKENQKIRKERRKTQTSMVDPPPLNLDKNQIVINEIDDIRNFRAKAKPALQAKLEESFVNLGPSTPENLVSEIEGFITSATILNRKNELLALASYPSGFLNSYLFETK